VIDVPPLSIFVADTRSRRTSGDRRRLMTDDALRKLEDWSSGSRARDVRRLRLGTVALPRPGGRRRAVVDLELADYEDYPRIMRPSPPRERVGDVVCLTGDVHWVGSPWPRRDPAPRADRRGDLLADLPRHDDRRRQPEPRAVELGRSLAAHSDAPDAPDVLAPGVFENQRAYPCMTLHKQKGNHS